jgi:hypothetical protein
VTRDHRRSRYSLLGVVLVAVGAGVTGCGSESAESARISKSFDETINYQSFGTTSAVDCADGKSLNVAGSNNRLTVRGSCEAVNVAGADNRITVERVEKSLTVTGLNNSITYRSGEPTVDDRGSGNTIADKR